MLAHCVPESVEGAFGFDVGAHVWSDCAALGLELSADRVEGERERLSVLVGVSVSESGLKSVRELRRTRTCAEAAAGQPFIKFVRGVLGARHAAASSS